MALNPLANSLSLLKAVPNSMNYRTEAVSNNPYWDPATQYFKGDCVVSPENDGIYVFGGETGANLNQTTIRGGVDPALGDSTSGWWPMQNSGLLQSSTQAAAPGSVTTVVGAGGAVVVPASLSLDLTANNFYAGRWLVTLQAQCTVAGPGMIAGNGFDWILTPTGTAPVVVRMTTGAPVGTLTWGVTGSAVVTIPTDGTSIALSAVNGVAAWAAAPTLANVVVTYSRLSY